MTKIILLNGPAGSGKDTIADHLVQEYPCMFSKQSFKESLYELTAGYFGVSLGYIIEQNSDRVTKETPNKFLGGKTPREALIYASEDVYKPRYGKSVFGQKAKQRLVQSMTNVFSDSGFIEEAEPLLEQVGTDNMICVQIERDGCSFENDSRDYVGVPRVIWGINEQPEHHDTGVCIEYPELNTVRIINNGSESQLLQWMEAFAMEFHIGEDINLAS